MGFFSFENPTKAKDAINAKWIFAGLIVTGIFLLVALVGGFSSFLSELMVDAAFGLIPFPFDLLVTWSVVNSSTNCRRRKNRLLHREFFLLST